MRWCRSAPRVHGELLKLGFEVARSTVAKYMVKRRGSPSQGWRTFLRNHAPDIAAMDLFVVPTIGFKLVHGFVIVRLHRRDLVWNNVTTNPTAEWVARQITEAFPWDGAPRFMIRDRDRIYGTVVTRRLRAMGIRDKGTSNNCHRSSGAPNLPTNDSALFSFRFRAVHPKDLRDSQLRQLFEVPYRVFRQRCGEAY